MSKVFINYYRGLLYSSLKENRGYFKAFIKNKRNYSIERIVIGKKISCLKNKLRSVFT